MNKVVRIVTVPIIGHFACSKSGVFGEWRFCNSTLFTVIKLEEMDSFLSFDIILDLSGIASQLILSDTMEQTRGRFRLYFPGSRVFVFELRVSFSGQIISIFNWVIILKLIISIRVSFDVVNVASIVLWMTQLRPTNAVN